MSTAVSSLGRTLDAPPEEALPAGSGVVLPAADDSIATPRRSPWWVEAVTVAWLAWAYDAVTNLAPLRLGPALAHGRDILSAERSLGIAPERSLDRWLAGYHAVGVVVSYYYDNAHFIVTFGLLLFLWWKRADIYRPLRSALVLMNVIAFVVFWRYPVAPPRMLGGGIADVVAQSGVFGSWHTGALASDANQLAAMPSLHIAWALWCTVAVWRMTDRVVWRTVASVYPLLTGLAVLATGNHYVFDIVGGALLAGLAMVLVAAATRLWGRLRPGPAVGAAVS